MGAGDDARPTKVCPDCGESVLVTARRCRFCGFRFDEPEEQATNQTGSGWLAFLRRPPRRSTIPTYLAQAGVMLDDDEQPLGMWLGRVNGSDAYVIVTTGRLFVTEVKLYQKRPSLVVGRLLRDLTLVEVGRRHLKSTLVMQWRDSSPMVVTKLSPQDMRALHAALLGGRGG
jgi:hypothetical protein